MIINLVNTEKSELPVKIIKFPDGQVIVDVDSSSVPCDFDGYFKIYSRGSWNDLQIVSGAVKAIRHLWSNEILLYIPYIGGRSDRRFSENQAHYLKEVYAPVLNSLNCYVYTLDPHSDVVDAVITNCCPYTNKNYVETVLKHSKTNDNCLVVPDNGALKKCHEILSLFSSFIVCDKTRDISTGKISSINIPNLIPHADSYYIVDDICDGGRTFIEIGKLLRPRILTDLNLVVTHGIFSNGFTELLSIFSEIHSTNSFMDMPDEECVLEYDAFELIDNN